MRPGSSPSGPIPIWAAPDGVDRSTAQGVVDLAARVGVALLATGAPAAEAVSSTLVVAHAYGLRSIHVDVTFSSVTVSYHRGPTSDPMTLLRVVPVRTQDFIRYVRLRELIEALTTERPGVDEARDRLDSVISAAHPYRRWVVTTALGCLAAAVAVQLGAGVLIAVLSLVSVVVAAVAQRWLAGVGFAPFFRQAVAAAIPTMVAAGTVVFGSPELRLGLNPSLIVAAGIVVLLSGLSFVGAARDAIEGFYVTAVARAAEVFALTLAIVVGVVAVLVAATRSGLRVYISSSPGGAPPAWVAISAAGVIAGMFAIAAYGNLRAILLSTVAGGAAWVVHLACIAIGAGPPSASGVSALVVGFFAQLVARRMRVPALVATTAAILPLVPGRAIYQGLFQLVNEPTAAGLADGLFILFEAAGIGVAMAAGVTLGTSMAQLVLRARAGLTVRWAPGASSG